MLADGGRRPAWAEIDLGALGRNVTRLRDTVAPGRLMAVVKADAYGHGVTEVALRLQEDGAETMGVAFLGEAIQLRDAGVSVPILVLGPTFESEPEIYNERGVTPTISGIDQLELWMEWCEESGKQQPIHLKLDTGMSRLGVALDELPVALEMIRSSDHLKLAGVLSHLANADEPPDDFNDLQIERFDEALELLEGSEKEATVHLANSAGALYLKAARHQMVRIGISLFGVDPARQPTELEPVMTIKATVVAVRTVAAGTRVGYGGEWCAERATTLGVVPVGYGDGYPWRLSSKGSVLIGGKARPITGRISMDMTVVDLGGDAVEVGDEAVLLGAQGERQIDVWDLADQTGTMAWEILCRFGLRLPRRYVG